MRHVLCLRFGVRCAADIWLGQEELFQREAYKLANPSGDPRLR
jgi:hypothetical protein